MLPKRMLRVLLLTIGLTLSAMAQQSPRRLVVRVQKKLALVIGNGAYSKSPLKNPVNDSAAMATTLRSIGFEVTEKRDLTFRQLRAAVDSFVSSIQSGDMAFFYYAGHGVQSNEQNYLIPVDFDAASESDLPYEAYAAAQIRDKLESSGARLRVIVLDACRNNPFRKTRDGSRGLSSMGSAVEGTYIAYATADNSVADDNPSEGNGLYTSKLISALRTPGLDLKQVFEKAKTDVWAASGQRQRPFTYDGVIGSFTFVEGAHVAEVKTPPPPDLSAQEEIAFWNGVEKSDAASIQLYLDRYPKGRFAALAQRSLDRMRAAAAPPTERGDPTAGRGLPVRPADPAATPGRANTPPPPTSIMNPSPDTRPRPIEGSVWTGQVTRHYTLDKNLKATSVAPTGYAIRLQLLANGECVVKQVPAAVSLGREQCKWSKTGLTITVERGNQVSHWDSKFTGDAGATTLEGFDRVYQKTSGGKVESGTVEKWNLTRVE
jgi:Caspase domain